LFHISSPRNGWNSSDSKSHADYINPADIPGTWCDLHSFTLDVEAKAKELAVLRLMAEVAAWAATAGPQRRDANAA
jgi:UV DNA damage endonuclease